MKGPIDLEPLFPNRTSGESLGAQLTRRLRTAIESGFFPRSSRLLPSRELAKRLGLSRNTVTSALEQLIAEGYLEGRVGSGTFVLGMQHEKRPKPPAAVHVLPSSPNDIAVIGERLDAVGSSFGPLRVGAPDLSAFPTATWERLERATRITAAAQLDYADSSGSLALRRAIAGHIAQFRGVVAEPEQITVTAGTQGALHLIAFTLGRCGNPAVLEDPSYQYASAVFAVHALRSRPVKVDDFGLRTSELPRRATLAYVTPSHQFPLGGAMPLARRAELLEWSGRANAYIIEDDYDSEFDAHPVPALQSLDRDERVVYVGTFSKTLAPGVRIAYVVAPPHLTQAFRSAREVTSRGVSERVQATVAAFITRGHFSRHVRRMSTVYERRRNILVDVLSKKLPREFTIGPSRTGLHVAVQGPPDFDDVGVANSLPQGHRVLPLSLLCIARTDCKGVVAGFSAEDDEAVADAAGMLAASLRARLRRSA